MRDTDDRLAALLHARGSRATPQRQLVIEQVLATHGHIVPEAIYQEIARRFPSVNRSTIYRTLQLLEQMGLVTHTHVEDGSTRYHRAEEPAHMHLVCHGCGTIQEIVDLSVGEPLRAALQDRYGFASDLTHLAIAGYCRACASERGNSSEPHAHRPPPPLPLPRTKPKRPAAPQALVKYCNQLQLMNRALVTSIYI